MLSTTKKYRYIDGKVQEIKEDDGVVWINFGKERPEILADLKFREKDNGMAKNSS